MSGFNFEKNLPHQVRGVEAVLGVFNYSELEADNKATVKLLANPKINLGGKQFKANIKAVQQENNISHDRENFDASNVLDISMETGTGKTYTYTQTIFELNRSLKINKFIIVVPTLSIKAGTVNFLKSDSLKEHFRESYDREIKTYIVESQKGSKKTGKNYMPQSICDFVNANSINEKYIHVLIINAGMINSDSLTKKYDTSLFDNDFDVPFKALAATRPIVIIDEPHKFPTAKKTWGNIEKLKAQYIIRYGATFTEGYKNLLYRLTAVDAFNQDLVKGIDAFIENVQGNETVAIKLTKTNGKIAEFELNDNGKKSKYSLGKQDALSAIHHEIHDLTIDSLNTKKVLLSNGLELSIGDVINPYSYAQTLQDSMIKKAIKEHFKIEKAFLTKTPRIKPLTLFFIDDIEGYRDGNCISGSLKTNFEIWIKAEAKKLLETESDPFYREYLEKTIKDVSMVHGGYFSKDNSEKDDKIEQEITEILHDKEKLLSLDNPRRFIFSKWTLREGWDNPNVFQICKLRSSGSTTSKLQEVGRGLRLPVNEFMSRVKGEDFRLNYFVDSTEKDFVKNLIREVNETSGQEEIPTSLTDEIKSQIIKAYTDVTKRQLTNDLSDKGIIDDNDNFIADGYLQLKALYPNAFAGTLKKDKIRPANSAKLKTKMRVGKFDELKSLWEVINQKAILEYKIENEDKFCELFRGYLDEASNFFVKTGIKTQKQSLYINDNIMFARNEESINDDFEPIVTMEYGEFLLRLSQVTLIKTSTLHKVFADFKETLNINQYLNAQTIRSIKSGFSKFLLNNAFGKFELGYTRVSNTVHPTKFTAISGQPLNEINASDVGVHQETSEKPSNSYLFDEVFYDSQLEKTDITTEIEGVTVFTKIPKNSIKIPVAGGFSYSPDFAYIIKTNNGEILNLVIEAKDVDDNDSLRDQEKSKIKHAEQLFNKISQNVKVEFKTQFKNEKVVELINTFLKEQ